MFRMCGTTIQLCRWQVTYKMDDLDMVKYVPTEEEADAMAERYSGTKAPLDTSADEWADGIDVGETSQPMEAARTLIAQGKSAYLNSLTIPSTFESVAAMAREMLKRQPPENNDQKILVSGLYEDWSLGDYAVGDIRNANGQTWECYQVHKNSEYPDITPDNPQTWANFWKPLHGKTLETARPWVKPEHGTTDLYLSGEYMIYTDGKLYKCLSDTNFSPEEYPQAWEKQGG